MSLATTNYNLSECISLSKHSEQRQKSDRQNQLTDFSYLKEISMGDDKMIENIIQLFLQKTPIKLKQLQQAVKTKDWAKVYHLAHALKSSMRLIGVNPQINHFASIEYVALHRKDLKTIPFLLQKSTAICIAIISELQQLDKLIY
ncbi:Hpt domain-containing protein [Rapidithrix thailandica]|uniref:Hpt domain-containing protein n=1 Tax=Rapidithrix thailandica TaxID=413964 RepID=A0AAW9SBK4_9BACT